MADVVKASMLQAGTVGIEVFYDQIVETIGVLEIHEHTQEHGGIDFIAILQAGDSRLGNVERISKFALG